MNETDTLKRISNRLKKLLILIIIIPILTGVAAYLFSSTLPSTYSANGTIILGNFQDEKITNIGALPQLMTTPSYLKGMDKNHVLNVNNLLKHLQISTDTNSKTITFTINGSNEKQVKNSLNQLIQVFMDKSNQVYMEHKNNMLENIKSLKNEKVSGLAAIQRDEQLYERNNDLMALRPSVFKAPISLQSSHSDPKKRAVLGFLVGIMLDVAILLIPEIFRKPEGMS